VNKAQPVMDKNDGPKQSGMENQMIKVAGNCDLCKERIEIAAKSVPGVVSAVWNINDKMLNVKFNVAETNSDAIQKAVTKAGHDTEKFKATDDVYNKLPECCLYRKK